VSPAVFDKISALHYRCCASEPYDAGLWVSGLIAIYSEAWGSDEVSGVTLAEMVYRETEIVVDWGGTVLQSSARARTRARHGEVSRVYECVSGRRLSPRGCR